ncbi:hypothetical protein CC80DRAFT_537078 [Byssothecium circinans]|uniref:Uncharacterized protein n=1 Tax=Byssothecium circinans TaxID=147558 RepID=A0A6A5TU66_9PLEO|nr:hypothetical protein CC80DRAFT_537078 [Byssothecium circinans]
MLHPLSTPVDNNRLFHCPSSQDIQQHCVHVFWERGTAPQPSPPSHTHRQERNTLHPNVTSISLAFTSTFSATSALHPLVSRRHGRSRAPTSSPTPVHLDIVSTGLERWKVYIVRLPPPLFLSNGKRTLTTFKNRYLHNPLPSYNFKTSIMADNTSNNNSDARRAQPPSTNPSQPPQAGSGSEAHQTNSNPPSTHITSHTGAPHGTATSSTAPSHQYPRDARTAFTQLPPQWTDPFAATRQAQPGASAPSSGPGLGSLGAWYSVPSVPPPLPNAYTSAPAPAPAQPPFPNLPMPTVDARGRRGAVSGQNPLAPTPPTTPPPPGPAAGTGGAGAPTHHATTPSPRSRVVSAGQPRAGDAPPPAMTEEYAALLWGMRPQHLGWWHEEQRATQGWSAEEREWTEVLAMHVRFGEYRGRGGCGG